MERLRPRFCPQCAAALVVAHDGTRERRGCRQCGWIWSAAPAVLVAAVVEHGGRAFVAAGPPAALPGGAPDWAEEPADAALRLAHAATGLRLSAPQFLGFIHLPSVADHERFALTLAFVVQCEAAPPAALAERFLRLRELPFLPDEAQRYALDAFRAWLERQR